MTEQQIQRQINADHWPIGARFGLLTVTGFAPKNGRHKMVECVCDCGGAITLRLSRLTAAKTDKIGCGCLRGKAFRHRESHSRLYRIWDHMVMRCHSPTSHAFPRYGGRGITVCAEWRDYIGFRDWARANGYRDDLSIDRIDNDSGYRPSNCRWATAKEQMNNRGCNVYIEYDGRRQTLTQWSEELRLSRRRALAFLKNQQ